MSSESSKEKKQRNMSVRVHLDNPNQFFTNLDYISGKIILALPSDETISAIVVKLEGESKTILIKPPPSTVDPVYRNPRDDRTRIALENHKILYKIQTVFPTQANSSASSSFTLRAGHHEYPFRFKIPWVISCYQKPLMC